MLPAMSGETDPELERYADLIVELAEPSANREEILRRQGFDEDGWEVYDDAWQERLSADERVSDAQGEVPPLWLDFSQALQRAQERRTTGLLPLDRYAGIARVMARGGDVAGALRAEEISMLDFLHAHRHWLQLATKDSALAAKLTKLLS